MANKTHFAGLHILMRAIPDGPADASRRLSRYWYRESRCQVRTGRQKNCALYSYKSVKICVNPRLMNYLCAYKASFCASLRLKNPFNQRNPRLNISSCSSYLRGEKIREISVNPWLINHLRACKALYICRDTFTDVMSPLQIRPFMQNEPNFRKSQMNVNNVLTKYYEKRTLGQHGKNEPKTNPIYRGVASGEDGTNPIVSFILHFHQTVFCGKMGR